MIATTMTAAVFFKGLKRLARRLRWKVTPGGHIRGETRTHSYCPVTALATARSGRRFSPGILNEAAASLNLPLEIAGEVAAAADHETHSDAYLETLRHEILNALNLGATHD